MARGARVRGGHDDGGGLLHLHPQGPPKEPPREGPLTPSRPASPHPAPALRDAADEGTPLSLSRRISQLRGPQALVEGDLERSRERERGRGIGEAAPELIVTLYPLRLPRGARSTSSSVILSFTADEAGSRPGKKKHIHTYACGSDEREARPHRVRGNRGQAQERTLEVEVEVDLHRFPPRASRGGRLGHTTTQQEKGTRVRVFPRCV